MSHTARPNDLPAHALRAEDKNSFDEWTIEVGFSLWLVSAVPQCQCQRGGAKCRSVPVAIAASLPRQALTEKGTAAQSVVVSGESGAGKTETVPGRATVAAAACTRLMRSTGAAAYARL